MMSLTPVEWTVVGPIIEKRANTLSKLIESGSRVEELGFLINTVDAVMEALNAHRNAEDEAWDAHKRSKGLPVW